MANLLQDRYDTNLTELAARQPDVARVVAETPIPGEVRLTIGRDGSPTFRIPGDAGRPVWFGGSSMPATSAAEIVGRFRGDGRNVALPGVLTGVEPIVILAAMPKHSALFVLERRPLHVKLAFRLYDYREAIRRGRLVFLLDDPVDLGESFRTFYERYPGYELPLVLLPVAQRCVVEMAELQARVESAGGVVTRLQADLVEARRASLIAQRVGDASGVAVLSADPRPAVLEQGRRIERGLRVLGMAHAFGVPDAPQQCHVLARLDAIAEASADLVVFVNGGAGAMAKLLPDDLPVASWFLPGAVLPVGDGPGVRSGWTVWASSLDMREALIGTGVAPASIRVAAPAADDALVSGEGVAAAACPGDAIEVAVVSDLPDDRPEACHVTLPSHVRLWEALRSVAAERIDRFDPGVASAWLDEAQRRCETDLREASLRERFLDSLQTHIVPGARAVRGASALLHAGCRVGAWGSHWPAIEGATELRRGAIPLGAELWSVFRAAKIVAFPDASPVSIQRALDALAVGTSVMVRNTLDRPFAEMYPGLDELVAHLHLYESSQGLVETARGLLASDGEGARTAAAAQAAVRGRHLVSHRLRIIIEATRVRRAEAAASR